MGYFYASLGEKHNLLESLRKFSLENCEKFIVLVYFSKNLTNHALIFRAFGRKLQIVGKF